MHLYVYIIVAISLISAVAILLVYRKKKYPGLLFPSGFLIALSAFAIYLLHFRP